MSRSICVFCSSSDTIAGVYRDAATQLGHAIGARGYDLVYGGGRNGLMGVLARAVHAAGGRVVGVIPQPLHALELAYTDADELVVTADLRERKGIMERRAGAFVAMPGGFGTIEEALEILTLKQLGLHAKPIIFLNVAGFFDGLFTFFERLCEGEFARKACLKSYAVAGDAQEVMSIIDGAPRSATSFSHLP